MKEVVPIVICHKRKSRGREKIEEGEEESKEEEEEEEEESPYSMVYFY